MQKQELEIYIHIPFCVKKCEYCDFLSFQKYNESYVPALLEEIKGASLQTKEEKDYKVRSIFIGGGTPSILEGKHIEAILQAVYTRFEIDKKAEITIEVNPGTITKEKFMAYKNAGINRISMGLQSTNNIELKELGRIHTYEEFLQNYNLARQLGFSNINIDLMSAIPKQSVESFRETLGRIIELEPEHISAYSLIIEEETSFFEKYQKNFLELPREEEERQMYYDTKSMLEKAGYKRYEISNYCKKDYECIHNIGYWRRVDYIGFGLGASSLIDLIRFTNETNMEKYIQIQNDKTVKSNQEIHTLSKQEEMEEFMFLGLRMIEGVSKQEFYRLFGQTYEQVYGICSSKLMKQGLLQQKQDVICLTDKGIDLSNQVMAQFLLS